MLVPVVRAPVAYLQDKALTASAKVVGLVVRCCTPIGPINPFQLNRISRVPRPTIIRGLAQLASVGWYDPGLGAMKWDRQSEPSITFPSALLIDTRVGFHGRVLYGSLQLTPEFRDTSGNVTYAVLSQLAGVGHTTVRRAIRELAHAGWMEVQQDHMHTPVQFAFRHPTLDRTRSQLAAARRKLNQAPYRGEALMRAYLSLLVASDHYEDDASPGFLVSPQTDERMQLDRYYGPNVAFEFNGPQHYGPTKLFSEDQARQQRVRDHLKVAVCLKEGIHLVVIHPEDLSLQGMQQKVGGLLPLRTLADDEPLIAFLESASKRYREAVRRGWQPERK